LVIVQIIVHSICSRKTRNEDNPCARLW
jgi:hypothetical protein